MAGPRIERDLPTAAPLASSTTPSAAWSRSRGALGVRLDDRVGDLAPIDIVLGEPTSPSESVAARRQGDLSHGEAVAAVRADREGVTHEALVRPGLETVDWVAEDVGRPGRGRPRERR